MIEDDPDYNCCYETDESNVNPVCIIATTHTLSCVYLDLLTLQT